MKTFQILLENLLVIIIVLIAVILFPLTLTIFIAFIFSRSSKINQKFKTFLIPTVILIGFFTTLTSYGILLKTEFISRKLGEGGQLDQFKKIETKKIKTDSEPKQNTSKKQSNSDMPPEIEAPQDEINRIDKSERAIVSDVIDGDTIVLDNNEIVRLIGINAPEKEQFYYQEAKKELEKLVLKKEVRLEKDVTDRDRYHRLLRYVYVDNLFVNLEMVKRGYANVFTYPPDVRYNGKFLAAEREAREKEIGLWQKSDEKIKISVIFIHADAAGNDNYNLNDEYVVFKNIGTSVVDMTGWTVKDAANHLYTFPNFKLSPGASFTLYTGVGEDTKDKLYWNRTADEGAIWNNAGDTLYLRDKNGGLVLIYSY